MSTILFVSYEIHPTTWGGAGVLLHHAAVQLLSEGHRVVFLLDPLEREAALRQLDLRAELAADCG